MSATPPSIEDVMASIRRIVDAGPVQGEGTASATEAPPPPTPPPLPPLAGGATVDAFLRSMLEPMLKAWLDANLPEIVEAATHAEIRRLTARGD